MSMTTDQIVQIVSAGGGVVIDGPSKTADQLAKIASAAARSTALVFIKNAHGKTASQLIQIGAASHGRIIFDLT